MSDYACETCGAPLRDHGGPRPPRWCAEHRKAGALAAQAERQREKRARERAALPGQRCGGCNTPLLSPADDGLCGFCKVEVAGKPADLVEAA